MPLIKLLNIFYLFQILSFTLMYSEIPDLTLIGRPMHFGWSLVGIPASIIQTLKDDTTINYICTSPETTAEKMNIPVNLKEFLKKSSTEPGRVALSTDILWNNQGMDIRKYLPNSEIKLAYSMCEGSRIPQEWVNILNSHFDAVIVPDKFLVDVYQNSDVKIPIFVLPCIIELDEFLKIEPKCKFSSPFIFGVSAVNNWERKNIALLIEAFNKEFGNNPNVILKIHSSANKSILNKILQTLGLEKDPNNIQLCQGFWGRGDYVNFISSLNCLVSVSRGEGFSIVPREALASGVPCILSNNTGHITICETGFVESVECPITVPPSFLSLPKNEGGYFLSCTLDGIRIALRNVYNNYNTYLDKALQGREWAKNYTGINLKAKYLNLVKPKKIILGNQNIITEDYFMTESAVLYEKYISTFAK